MNQNQTDEQKLEQELQARGLNAPRLTPDMIDALIANATYTLLPSGRAMCCEITTTSGAIVHGFSITVSAENFREDIGREQSFKFAREELWKFEGYALRRSLAQQAA